MILLFKKGLEYKGSIKGMPSDKDSNIFPLMSLPLDLGGEPTDLNDFQWWAYTDKWKGWLKKNPREWQAESEDYRFEKTERLIEDIANTTNPAIDYFEHQITNIWEGKQVASFSEYAALLENENSGSSAVTKKFIKLGFAIDKLLQEGKLYTDLKIDNLKTGEPYAIVVDPFTEGGKPLPEGRQALRLKKLGSSAGVIIASVDYSIPIGSIKDPDNYLKKVGEYAKDVLIGGAQLAVLWGVAKIGGGMFMSWRLYKGARNIYQNFGNAQKIYNTVKTPGMIKTSWEALKGFATKAFTGRGGASAIANAARVTLPSGAFVEGGLAYSSRGILLRGAAAQSTKLAAERLVAQAGGRAAAAVAGRAAAGAGAAAAGSSVVAAEASNPVGWVIAAVSVIGSGVNQIWNWYSDKQAPKYDEVDDFAYGTFSPGNIPTGKSITICWTSDGGGGAWGFVIDLLSFSKDDTRTTMELVKIGEFGERSLFIILQINSKQFKKLLKDNDLVLLSFANSDKFERGYLDNDDLEFETIVIPDITQLTIGTSLVGWSKWEDMKQAYDESPSSPIYVPSEAKSRYEFHYKDKKGKEINVTGSLLSESEIQNTYMDQLLPIPPGKVEESSTGHEGNALKESRVLSFLDYQSSINEEDEKRAPGLEFGREYKPNTEADPEADTENKTGEEGKEKKESYEDELEGVISSSPIELQGTGYDQIPIIAYRVSSIGFVDPNETGRPDKFEFFLVGEQSIDPQVDQPVLVETVSEDPLADPRYGLATYIPPKEETEETPEEEGQGDEEQINFDDVDTEGKKVETTRGDVQIKSRSGSLTIKDKEVEGGINIFDEFSTEQLKRELNINDWDSITGVKVRYDREDEPISVVLTNRFAPTGKRRRIVKRGEEGFESALSFAKSVEDGISYKD